MGRFLTKKDILAAEDVKLELLSVPEWGGHVYVRVMSGTDRDAFEAGIASRPGGPPNLANVRARLCALCVCDDKGVRLFSDHEVGELGKKSGAALNRVFEAAQRLNALTDEEVEELAKN